MQQISRSTLVMYRYGHSWAPTLKILIGNQQPMPDNRHMQQLATNKKEQQLWQTITDCNNIQHTTNSN
jgi:hypothetical protein